MLKYKSVASLSLDEARVLLEPETSEALFEMDLTNLAGSGDRSLINALASVSRTAKYWEEILTNLYVKFLDINRAPRNALLRIPGLSPDQVELIFKSRPYFNLTELRTESSDLKQIGLIAAPYLMHEGYYFFDKIRGSIVDLIPSDIGVIVKFRERMNSNSLDRLLISNGLSRIGQDDDEFLAVCRWEVSPSEKLQRLRTLKESGKVETISPILKDAQNKTRFIYPDRLDLALHENTDLVMWEQILDKFNLIPVEQYSPNYGSVRVEAHPHDLGALYRTLRILSEEHIVHFVEPTYIVDVQ